MPRPTKQTKGNGKAPAVEPEVVTGNQGPQLNDSAIGNPDWNLTMQKTKSVVDDIQSQSGEQDSPQIEQPEKEENSLTTLSGGYFERKRNEFQEAMVGYQAEWANCLEEMQTIMKEDVEDAKLVTKVLRKRQADRRKEWKRALDIDL